MTTNNEVFEKFFPRPLVFADKAHELEMMSKWNDAKITWELSLKAATTEAYKRIAELEVQLQNWKDFSKKVQKIDFNDYLQLQASNNHLREALEEIENHGCDCDGWEYCKNNYPNKVAQQALSATPAQSLAEHDNELLERAASIVQNKIGSTDEAPLSDAVTEILALKEVK